MKTFGKYIEIPLERKGLKVRYAGFDKMVEEDRNCADTLFN